MTTVLLAVDENDESIEAVRQARSLFGSDATYLAVNVAEKTPTWAPVPMAWGGVYPYPFAARYPAIEAEVEGMSAVDVAQARAEDVTEQAGVTATPVGDVGDASEAILDAASVHDADVIVVGSSDKGWFRRLFEGSVSRSVLEHSPVPVLVAGRHPED
jgi:nucleotide-binding universal stress UspA family protein